MIVPLTWADMLPRTAVRNYNEKGRPEFVAVLRSAHSTHLDERYAPMQHDSPTAVYRYYDRHGVLIYVGITKQGMGRKLQHASHAEWWPHVASQEVDHLPDRRTALALERDLIRKYEPPFNKQHNPDHARARAGYEAFRAGPSMMQPTQIFGALKKQIPLRLHEAHEDGWATWATDPVAFNLARIVQLHEPTRITTPSGQIFGRITKTETVGLSVHLSGQVSRSLLEGFEVEQAYAKLRCHPGKPMRFEVRSVMVPREADL